MSLPGNGVRAFILLLFTTGTTSADAALPTRIPAPGGELAITSAREQEFYDKWNFAPARRAGDYVYSLIRDGGVVEVQMIAYAPQGRRTAR